LFQPFLPSLRVAAELLAGDALEGLHEHVAVGVRGVLEDQDQEFGVRVQLQFPYDAPDLAGIGVLLEDLVQALPSSSRFVLPVVPVPPNFQVKTAPSRSVRLFRRTSELGSVPPPKVRGPYR
jgi:hypothetical protein